MQPQANRMTRVTGATEVLVLKGPCRLVAITPEFTTTGTIAIRDDEQIGGAYAPRHTCAIGVTQQGVSFGAPNGVLFNEGITITLSAGTDAVNVIWNTAL